MSCCPSVNNLGFHSVKRSKKRSIAENFTFLFNSAASNIESIIITIFKVKIIIVQIRRTPQHRFQSLIRMVLPCGGRRVVSESELL